jgi:hypothetical protein
VLSKRRVITLLDQGKPKKLDILKKELLMIYTAFGGKFSLLAPLGPPFPVVPTDHKVLSQLYAHLGHDVKPPITVTERGFDGVLEGLQKLRKGESRGKLVLELSHDIPFV